MARDPPGASRDPEADDRPPESPSVARPTDAGLEEPLSEPGPRRPPRDPAPRESDPVLLELDRIAAEVRDRRTSAPTGPAPFVGPREAPKPLAREENLGDLSGYIEERLLEARRSIDGAQEEVGRLSASSQALGGRVAAIRSELDKVTTEYRFARLRGLTPEPDHRERAYPADAPRPAVNPAGGEDQSLREPAARFRPQPVVSARAAGAAYRGFTVDKYNETIDGLKARRRRLAVATLGLSAVIGAALAAVVLFSPPSYPPLWIAALPVVWVVPVPFFLLSFRGSHRVLDRNHLNLPGEP